MCDKQQNLRTINTSNNIPYKNCLNCGAELNGMYCHVCGQQATSKTPTLGGFIFEYLNNAFIWDSQCLQTVWNLIRRPGYLTNEFLSGKFVSQEHPLKLNMFLLFAFVTLFFFFSGTEKMNDSVLDYTKDERVLSVMQFKFLMDNHEYAEKLKESPRDTVQLMAPLILSQEYPGVVTNLQTIEDTQGESLDKWTAILPRVLIEDEKITLDTNGYYHFNEEAKEAKESKDELEVVAAVWTKMTDILEDYFPMIVLLTAPFLSMSLGFVQRKNRLPRINHFIFALHYIAFLELLIIGLYILHLTVEPSMTLLEGILNVASCVYLTIALRRVYGINTWFKAIVKALFTSLVYCIIGLFILFCILFIACYVVLDMY